MKYEIWELTEPSCMGEPPTPVSKLIKIISLFSKYNQLVRWTSECRSGFIWCKWWCSKCILHLSNNWWLCLNSCRYVEAKKKRHKKAKTEEDLDFPGCEKIKFGDVVEAPPKLVTVPKVASLIFDLHIYMSNNVSVKLRSSPFFFLSGIEDWCLEGEATFAGNRGLQEPKRMDLKTWPPASSCIYITIVVVDFYLKHMPTELIIFSPLLVWLDAIICKTICGWWLTLPLQFCYPAGKRKMKW